MKRLGRAVLILAGALVAACSSHGYNSVVPNGSQPDARFAHPQPRTGAVRALCAPAGLGEARCFALLRTDVRFDRPPRPDALKLFYGPLEPAQIHEAYNLPFNKGVGQTVGIVDAFDDPTAESDMATYRSTFGLPACTTSNGCFQKLNQQGKPSPLPKPNANWAGEITLDLAMVSATCPNCHIVLIEATTNSFKNLAPSVKTAVNAGANVVSNSYGGPECILNKKGKIVCGSPLSLAKAYNMPGHVVTASTGDFDWFAGPQAPADFTTVIAVGGTSIYPFNSKRRWYETGWSGAGSSCSHFVKRPSWIPKSTNCPKDARPTADVSAVSDPFPGVLVYETYPFGRGGFFVYGGTSVASPIIASVYALAGNSATVTFGKALYNAPKGSLNDPVVGANGIPGTINNAGQQCKPVNICMVTPGWDGPTGNGTPWGLAAF
jgi:subtilase family serine protease